MKIFISHKSIDGKIAKDISNEFERLGIPAYLDILDSAVPAGGKALTDHIKASLNDCTDIIVILSNETASSWWVPFEIGMAAQKDMPTSTFLVSSVTLPDFLSYWPRLKTVSDVQKYVYTRKKCENRNLSIREGAFNFARVGFNTAEFYTMLKKELAR